MGESSNGELIRACGVFSAKVGMGFRRLDQRMVNRWSGLDPYRTPLAALWWALTPVPWLVGAYAYLHWLAPAGTAWTPWTQLLVVLSLPFTNFLATVTHEAGHLAALLHTGVDVQFFIVGPLFLEKRATWRGWIFWPGWTRASEEPIHLRRPADQNPDPDLLFAAAGPLASLIGAAFSFAGAGLLSSVSPCLGMILLFSGVFHGCYFWYSILPGGATDGEAILAALAAREAAQPALVPTEKLADS